MSNTILIRGGTILTLGAKTANLLSGDVLIEGSAIAEVGMGIRSRGARIIDATDSIVMPGFVDTHRHLARSLFRNSGSNAADDLFKPLADFGPEDIYAATLIGLLGAAEAGITTVVDWSETEREDHLEAAIDAHRDSGLRTVLVDTRASGDLRNVGPGPTVARGIEAGSIDPSVVATARSAGLRVHIHGNPDADQPPDGILAEDVTLAHATRLPGPWLAAAADSGAAVSVAPAAEMAGSAGPPAVQTLMDLGTRIGLGVGDESVAPGDMFAQMRAVISVQHATYFDLKLAGKGGLPNLLGTRQVIKYGTADGAAAIGLDSVTGTLEAGKAADLIVLGADRPNIHPVNDPIGAVVWGMDTSNLEWVIAGGRVVMEDGSLTGNVAEARERAVAARDRVVAGSHP